MTKRNFTRRKLLGSLGAIGAASAGAGAGTWAYFGDSETSSDNSVSAGAADLNVHNGGHLYYSGQQLAPGDESAYVDKNLNLYNPESLQLDHIDIVFENFQTHEDDDGLYQEDGTDDDNDGRTNDLDDDSNPETSPGPDADTHTGGGMEKWVVVRWLAYSHDTSSGEVTTVLVDQNGDSLDEQTSHNGTTITDENGNGKIDLDDLTHPNNRAALEEHEPPWAGSSSGSTGETQIAIEVYLHEDTPNDYQGDVLSHDIRFDLEQAGQ